MDKTRIAIPNRRYSEIVPFTHDGIDYEGSISFLQDGTPVEIFVEGAKAGTATQSWSRDCAVAISFALQYGAPIEKIREALTRNDDSSPAGPLGALLDIVCAELPA